MIAGLQLFTRDANKADYWGRSEERVYSAKFVKITRFFAIYIYGSGIIFVTSGLLHTTGLLKTGKKGGQPLPAAAGKGCPPAKAVLDFSKNQVRPYCILPASATGLLHQLFNLVEDGCILKNPAEALSARALGENRNEGGGMAARGKGEHNLVVIGFAEGGT